MSSPADKPICPGFTPILTPHLHYTQRTTATVLCDVLMAHLWEVGRDGRLSIVYNFEPGPVGEAARPDPEELEERR